MNQEQRDRLAGIAERMRYWSQHWWRDSDTVRAAIRVDEFAAEIEALLAEPEAPQGVDIPYELLIQMRGLLVEIVTSPVGHFGCKAGYLPQLDKIQCDMLCAALGVLVSVTQPAPTVEAHP